MNNLTDATHKQMLWQQNCATWIPTNCPGAGHILIHDNGINRANPAYTSIDEIVPPVDANGLYSRVGNTYYGPTNYFWQYTNNPATNFFGADIGGAEREPNGDTLVTFGIRGTIFEVTSNRQTVWQYVNPVTHDPLAQGSTIPFDPNSTRIFRYRRSTRSSKPIAIRPTSPDSPARTSRRAAPSRLTPAR